MFSFPSASTQPSASEGRFSIVLTRKFWRAASYTGSSGAWSRYRNCGMPPESPGTSLVRKRFLIFELCVIEMAGGISAHPCPTIHCPVLGCIVWMCGAYDQFWQSAFAPGLETSIVRGLVFFLFLYCCSLQLHPDAPTKVLRAKTNASW